MSCGAIPFFLGFLLLSQISQRLEDKVLKLDDAPAAFALCIVEGS